MFPHFESSLESTLYAHTFAYLNHTRIFKLRKKYTIVIQFCNYLHLATPNIIIPSSGFFFSNSYTGFPLLQQGKKEKNILRIKKAEKREDREKSAETMGNETSAG